MPAILSPAITTTASGLPVMGALIRCKGIRSALTRMATRSVTCSTASRSLRLMSLGLVAATLNSVASTPSWIDFFANASCNASGNGEGKVYLGSTDVTTDGNCNAVISANLPVNVGGLFITATATQPRNFTGVNGSTSEFS